MKHLLLTLLICLFAISPGHSVDYKKSTRDLHTDHSFILERVSINIDDGNLILSPQDDKDVTIEITEDCGLYVNGSKIDMTPSQQELVEQYYDTFMQIIESAKRVGFEGARVGVHGAALGISVLANAFRLISPEYDQDDLERDTEKEAIKLEKKAKRLEVRASYLEDLADEFEILHNRLVEEVPAIKELDAF